MNIACINYKNIIRINKTAVIYNNLLKSPISYITLQISHGQRKHLFEINSQFGQAPSKRFSSPAVEYGAQDIT